MCTLLEAIAAAAACEDECIIVHLNALALAKHPRYHGMRTDRAAELTSALTMLSQRIELTSLRPQSAGA
jgi:hypothetical protein